LRVKQARGDRAIAVALGEPFALPPGARGRINEAGHGARLRCALEPHDEEIAAAIRESPLLELVEADRSHVRLRQIRVGWLLADAAHGATPATALATLRHPRPAQVREVLEHYFGYSLPLRLAELARDLRDALDLRVLACPRPIPPSQAMAEVLYEAPSFARGEYEVEAGALICFSVHNRSVEKLRVALLNVAASGRVQLVGEEPLEGGSTKRFWVNGALGQPFQMSVPLGRESGIDRLVAVGTTELSRDLSYLKIDRRFADMLEVARGGRQVTRSGGQVTRSGGAHARQVTHGGPDESVYKDLLFCKPDSRWTTARATVRTFQVRDELEWRQRPTRDETDGGEADESTPRRTR
jgi:hypothetical protein